MGSQLLHLAHPEAQQVPESGQKTEVRKRREKDWKGLLLNGEMFEMVTQQPQGRADRPVCSGVRQGLFHSACLYFYYL
jgi:hypothetical protein